MLKEITAIMFGVQKNDNVVLCKIVVNRFIFLLLFEFSAILD